MAQNQFSFIRVVYGCLPLPVGEIFVFLRTFVIYMVTFLLGFSTVYKCFQLFKFNLTEKLSNILSTMIVLFLNLFTLLLTAGKFLLKMHYTPVLKSLTCLKMDVIPVGGDK